jgi:hypothetical protein
VTPDSGMETYMLVAGLALIGSGLYGIFRPAGIAQRNQAHIDSGEETYFEERRSWAHYGRPPASPNAVRRAGWLAIAGGATLLCLAALGGAS